MNEQPSKTKCSKKCKEEEEGNRTFKSQRNFSSLQAENEINLQRMNSIDESIILHALSNFRSIY